MALQKNTYYWQISLNNPEELIDEYYVIDDVIIYDKEFVQKIHRLREIITAYCCFMKDDDETSKRAKEKLLKDLYNLLTSTNNLQYSEFIAFWKVFDFSYSVFRGIRNYRRKLDVLKRLVEAFCKRREELYSRTGYSDVSIQALFDSGVSRRKGTKGPLKVIQILKDISSRRRIHKITLESELDGENMFFLVDEKSVLFKKFCEVNKVRYTFGETHEGKIPDVIMKIGKDIFIVEAKHIKESGGAQDKQVLEVMEFIEQAEVAPNIHYLSFLDGVYFNRFINPPANSKAYRQKQRIEKDLNAYEPNYFVNTIGFMEMLNDLMGITLKHNR